MTDNEKSNDLNRREALGLIAASSAAAVTVGSVSILGSNAASAVGISSAASTPGAFVYTEVQISVPFDQAPWPKINEDIKKQPGFLNKTWLSGVKTNSLGGIYAFDSIENAQNFVTGYFPEEAGSFDAAHNTRVFDAPIVREASMDLGSPFFGVEPSAKPGAFVYTEVQLNMPFKRFPWAKRNRILKQEPGLITKTWLSGLHTNTIGGIDAFDTVENAKAFALKSFPETARKLNAAFYTRVFDASVTETASRDMYSPFYA
ncbi:YdhR family protein [Aestuariispira insulae]|uniref:Putative monooxygenase ydhR n=1 Tax=Aestuariispira insulae TaxID=1461337 RepID=A0A3D9HSM0_9PROT|nr:YdhR family protein [Aestuariispira insulae]RED52487.1 putative monooxygenase ydhR [Aestuariispira insulae]